MIHVSIDVEASGPFPGLYYLASIGAAPIVRVRERWIVDTNRTFYAELKPIEGAAEIPEAMAVHGLQRPYLEAHGQEPEVAMRAFAEYLADLGEPVRSAAWPASFDHPFVGYYLQRYAGQNPFGHSGFDIPSFAMGLFSATSRNALTRAMHAAGYEPPHNPQPHHAKHDAIEQAETLAWLFNHAEHR